MEKKESVTKDEILGTQLDITAPGAVEVIIDHKGKRVWVNVDGICKLRCCQIDYLEVHDERS